MKLIELVLDNWYLLVILYVLVTSLAGKFKSAGGAKPAAERRGRPAKPADSMPPFGGDSGGWPVGPGAGDGAPSPAGRPQMPAARPQAAPAAAEPRKAASAASDSQRRRLADIGAPASGPREAGTAAAHPRPQASAASRSRQPAAASPGPLGRVSPGDAARGMMWAEIFGPPRAKRPYRR